MSNANYVLARSILTRQKEKHPLFQIDATLNPYFGCAYNCMYCPYVVRSKVSVKTNFLSFLKEKLAIEKKKLHLGIGTSCEPYCEEEKEFRLTRGTVETAVKSGMPVQIFTKSELALEDAGMFAEYSEKGLLAVTISLFTLDRKLAKYFEPGFPVPEDRINLLKKLKKKGVFAGIALAPVMPYISDSKEQIEQIFQAVQKAGGDYILPVALNITNEKIKQKMDEAFLKVFPGSRLGFQTIYGEKKLPDDVYSSWMDQYFRILSGKYDIPAYLPVENVEPGLISISREIPE
ncbi:MAG: radical SAM protein [Elusimicrobiota bacterium]